MEKKNLLQKDLLVKTTTRSNGDLTIQQTMARELKIKMLEDIKETLAATYDVDLFRTEEGIAIIIPNDNEGFIPVVLDIKVKPLSYDYETEAGDYSDKQKAKADKKAEADKKKAEKEAKAKAKREAKAATKSE